MHRPMLAARGHRNANTENFKTAANGIYPECFSMFFNHIYHGDATTDICLPVNTQLLCRSSRPQCHIVFLNGITKCVTGSSLTVWLTTSIINIPQIQVTSLMAKDSPVDADATSW